MAEQWASACQWSHGHVLVSYVYGIHWYLIHWGRVTHICAGNLTIVSSDNGLSPGLCQAINWTNAGILLIGLLGTNFSEISIQLLAFSLKKIRLKVSNTFDSVDCEMATILSRHQYVKRSRFSLTFPSSTLILQQPCWGANKQSLTYWSPVRCGSNFKSTLFKLIIHNSRLRNCYQVNVIEHNL